MHWPLRISTSLLGLMLGTMVLAQPTHLDSLYWDTLMNERMEKFLRAPLNEFAVTVHRTSKEYGVEDLQVQTVEVAIILLGEAGINENSVEHLYDFLDSAAVHFYQRAEPLLLMSGDAGTRGTQWFMDRERDLGVQYIYNGLGCVRDLRRSNGEELFNLRTQTLIEPSKHSDAFEEMKALRKRFISDERDRQRADRSITRYMKANEK